MARPLSSPFDVSIGGPSAKRHPIPSCRLGRENPSKYGLLATCHLMSLLMPLSRMASLESLSSCDSYASAMTDLSPFEAKKHERYYFSDGNVEIAVSSLMHKPNS